MIIAFETYDEMKEWLRTHDYFERHGSILIGHYEFVCGKNPVVFDSRDDWEACKSGKMSPQFCLGGF